MEPERVGGVQPETIVSTRDLALAAYWHSRGLRLLKLVPSKKNKRDFDFLFEDPEDITGQLSVEYVNSESAKFDESMRLLKKATVQNGKRNWR